MGAGSNSIIFDDLERPGFEGHTYKSSISKTGRFRDKSRPSGCMLLTKLLKNTNRKPYTISQMVPLSMTLSDL